MEKLIIDPQFRDKIPPLTDAEFEQLQDNILADGEVYEPKVSYRDGKYWVFNGQHSIAAWRGLHNGEDKLIQCKVYKGMTWLDECDAFVQQNGLSKDPTTNQKLRAAYNSKNADVVDMVERAALCGFVVDFSASKTPTRIVATSALFRAYKQLGPEVFTDMLTAIKEAWYGDMDALSQQIIFRDVCVL